MQATELLFQTIFDQLTEPRVVVKPNAPNFTIVFANRAYLAATGGTAESLNGLTLWQLFKRDVASANGRVVFEAGLNDAVRHRAPVKLPIFRFDTAAAMGGRPVPQWWQVDISPVASTDGELIYLICTTRNVTLHVQDKTAILKHEHENAALLIRQQEQTEEAERIEQRGVAVTESEYRLNRIVSTTPVGLAIIKGAEQVIETVNDPLLKLWGRKLDAVLGRKLLDVLPELLDQPFFHALLEVYNNAKSIRQERQPAVIAAPEGETRHVFVDLSYDPLFDTGGKVDAILMTVNDVTAMVHAQQLLQDREEELETMNEELTATNEELHASLEELTAINEELNRLKTGNGQTN